ncbi:NAD(P)/FAD-dependent oxidoreductase [Undibacter mobilis]|uniref:FAD-binding oxidoreductase n=1 Tax=Undibacter mobilis TaxID=2292256 RepID=A0A371BC84_9BRAD|nr:FAD-binding oxidoreductase [Undibacter mobilis]RDV05172.1 FAD-binding oxidoreductase [Undibacter mobilis]
MTDTDPSTEPLPATWYEATRVARPQHPRLGFDLDVDVCVIGAGLAGLTVAREIAMRGWSVAVLEGGRIAEAASGRNTGFVLPGFAESVDGLVERIGLDHTKRLWALSEQGVDYVRRTIDDNNLPGVDPVPGWLRVHQTDEPDRVRADVERLRWIGADVEMWPTEKVRAELSSARYFSAVHWRNAFHIHPLNYALGLARLAADAGCRIFEETPALSIDPAGVRKRIVTPNGRLRAAHVVFAGNVQLGNLMPSLAQTLLPVNTFVMVTEPLGNRLKEFVRYRGAISDTARADNHYRIVDGDRLMVSGRVRVWQADAGRFASALAADVTRKFPGLGRVEAAQVWSGTLGRTIHRMPQIGAMAEGVWVASGFAGHGLNTTAMAGELIARGIVDGDDTWRLFAPYELVWAGGRTGAAVAQGLYWWRSGAAALAGSLSRYRERRRLAKAERDAAVAAAGPVIPPERLPADQIAAAPVAAAAPAADMPSGAPSGGQPERRKNRGKRRGVKKDGSEGSAPPDAAPSPESTTH